MKNYHHCFSLAVFGLWGCLGGQVLAADISGAQTVADLRARYFDKRTDCGRPSIPAFVCTGVIFRATIPSPVYKSWEPSPRAVQSGGFSFSFLRADAKFKRLVRYENNGFIVYPPLSTPAGKEKVNVLCAFPVDGATDTRADQGCGASNQATSNSNVCHTQGITTGEQWYAKHQADKLSNLNQCGFNVRDDANEKATASFNAFIRAMSLDKAESFEQQNELRLGIYNTRAPENLPIAAFFYLPGGLADAQYDQKDYFTTTGLFVPIIAMTLPAWETVDATFNYNEGDQVVNAPLANNQYIQSTSWVERYDPGTKKNEWSLFVTPTQKGREATAQTTDAVFAELLRFKDTRYWIDQNDASMRRQLACHYVISRSKPTWNMEPFRPNVTQDVAVANGCNPL